MLNESEAKDYSVNVTVSTCTSYEEIAYKADAGSEVWDVKAIVVPGEFKEEYYQKAAQEGEIIDTGYRQYAPVSGRGLYTVVVAGVDRKGNMVSCDYDFGFNVIDDDSQWVDCGNTTFTEDFCASRYIDIEGATYDVALQQHTSIAGYFRIVNPYATHPTITYPKYQSDHSHSHYIYINATDVNAPYIEASPIGVNLGYGDISVASSAGLMIASGKTPAEVAAAGVQFGKFDPDKNLTFPIGALVISEKGRDKGDWRPSAPSFSVNLPVALSGVDGVVSEEGDCEIYTLQGVRVSNASNLKGIYIKRLADGTVKKVQL